jgi:hypothetical protein
MYYIGLRGAVQYAGWAVDPGGAPMPAELLGADWASNARERTLAAVEEIRSGRIVAAPSDRGRCGWCDYVDVCRIETAAGRFAAGGE